MIKSFGFDLVTLISAFITGWLFKGVLAGERGFVGVIVSACIFIALSSLNTLLKKDFTHRAGVVAAEALVFSLVFVGLPLWTLVSVFFVIFIMFLWGALIGRYEMENNLEIRFFRVTQRLLSKTITALSVVVILLYVPQWQNKSDFISEDAFSSVFATSRGVASRLYPEFNFNSDMNALAQSLAQTKLNENSQYKLLPPAVKEGLVEKTSVEVVQSLGNNLGIELTGEEDIGTVLYRYISKLVDSWRTKLGSTFLVLWSIVAFLFIRGIGTLLGFFVTFFAYVIYHLLLVLDVIRIESELQPQEKVDFR